MNAVEVATNRSRELGEIANAAANGSGARKG